jgi:CBS domain-containing protein
MTPNVITATSDQTMREVCKIMCEHKIGSVIILRDTTLEKGNSTEYSNPIGIATERDVVTHLGSKTQSLSLETPVSEIMSHPVVTIQSNSSLKDGIETMQLRNIRKLPVIGKENGNEKMVGIVTEKDIIKAITKALPSSQTASEGMTNDQMQFGYRFMYERLINDDHFSKDTHPGMG